MRFWKLAVVLGAAWFVGCSSNSAPVGITISPTSTVVVLSGTQQFIGTVSGNANTNVTWAVSASGGTPITGGNSTIGTISTTGLYTAPAVLPNPATVTVTAIAQAKSSVTAAATVVLDSGIRVTISPATATIGTNETFPFTAVVTGSSNIAVTWEVNAMVGGNPTIGTISTTGLYTAPSTPMSVSVMAVSAADNTQISTASVTVVTAIDPTLSFLSPPTAAQGSVQQDIFLSGTNFFSTTTVLVNGTPVPSDFISTTFLHAVIPANLLTTAGSVEIQVQRQNGVIGAAQMAALNVIPVRPAIVGSSPDSAAQSSSAVTITLDGGYYSPLSTTALFNGQPRVASVVSPRQLTVGLAAVDTSVAGLFSLVVTNAGVPAGSPNVSAVNVAIEPPASAISIAPPPTVTVGTQPSAVDVNSATGIAVVVNHGAVPGTLSLIDLATSTVVNTVANVGSAPTSVAVDNVLNEAAVVNNGDNTLAVVDLNAAVVVSTIALPSNTTAFSVALNPLTHRALVANQSTNTATVVDLSTTPPSVVCVLGGTNPPNSCTPGISAFVSTGPAPSVAVVPRLNWAIVTPGGAGTVTIIDLGTPASPGDVGRTPSVVATLGLSPTVQGISVNPETAQALITDPNGTLLTQFSFLNQTTTSFTLDKGEVASAINPLTNIGVTVNNVSNQANVVDLRTMQPLVSGIPVGTQPQAVAVDAATNVAVIANEGSNNVSLLSLGPIRALHVTQSSPATTLVSALPATLTVVGGGFAVGSVVRLDQTNLLATTVLPAGCTTNCRELTATVPTNLLNAPRRFILDVLNPDATVSNVTDFTVIGAVNVGVAPGAVAVDQGQELAVVTNTGDGTATLVNLTNLTTAPPIPVGINPQGVAVLSRLGLAVVTNNGSNSATIVNLVTGAPVATISVGASPLGVAIDDETAIAVVANNLSNNATIFHVDTGLTVGTVAVDQGPIGVAIDPNPLFNYAAVTAATQNTVTYINLATDAIVGRTSFLSLPTDVTFDPVSAMFAVANSLQNNVVLVDPRTFLTTPIRVGINPQSVRYNFQTSTLATFNNVSRTVSVMDYLAQRIRAVLPLGGSSAFSVDIDQRTNNAVIADQANNRVLIVPLPR